MRIKGILVIASAVILLAGRVSAQTIFAEDFNSGDPGLTQIDLAPNDAGDAAGNGEETGALYSADYNAAGYVDFHLDRGRNTGGRTDSERSVLGIGQTLTEADDFTFSVDVNVSSWPHHPLGLVGMYDGSQQLRRVAGHALFRIRDTYIHFGLNNDQVEVEGPAALTAGVNYRLSATHNAVGNTWDILVTDLDAGATHWELSGWSSAVETFSLSQIGVGGWTDSNGEAFDILGTSDNWWVGTETGNPGDVDGNGIVDGLDLTAVLTAWETVPGDPLWNEDADLDGNGIVDGLDLTEVISNWTAAAAVPAVTSATSDSLLSEGPGLGTGSGPGIGNVGRGRGNVRRR